MSELEIIKGSKRKLEKLHKIVIVYIMCYYMKTTEYSLAFCGTTVNNYMLIDFLWNYSETYNSCLIDLLCNYREHFQGTFCVKEIFALFT